MAKLRVQPIPPPCGLANHPSRLFCAPPPLSECSPLLSTAKVVLVTRLLLMHLAAPCVALTCAANKSPVHIPQDGLSEHSSEAATVLARRSILSKVFQVKAVAAQKALGMLSLWVNISDLWLHPGVCTT